MVPPSVFAKEQPASSAPRNEAPQRTEPKPLLEEAPGSAQSKAFRMLDDTQVRSRGLDQPAAKVLFLGIRASPRSGPAGLSQAPQSPFEEDVTAVAHALAAHCPPGLAVPLLRLSINVDRGVPKACT